MQKIRARLRAATAEEHCETETAFGAILAALSDSRGSDAYGAFLRAHARAFPAIGRALAERLDWPAWRSRWDSLQSDLASLDLDPPPPLTVAPAASRAAALGMAYVLEGSRLGSTLLLTRLPAGFPAAYLGGGNDRGPWLQLLALLDTITPADEHAAISGARAAFRAFQEAAALQPVPRVLEPVS